MVKTKPIDRVTTKWASRVAVAGDEYTAGIQNPKRDWAEATKAAESAFEQGVQNAIAKKKFGKGVGKAGTEKWKRKALAVGPARFAAGVAAATDDYRKAMGEVLSAIEGITLPARGPKGSAQNYERSKKLGQALHEFAERKAGV